MKMKNALKKLISAISAAALTAAMAVSAYAAVSDVQLDVSAAKPVGPWENQPFSMEHYDPTKITAESEVKVTYTYTAADGAEVVCPVELIVQSWSNPDTPMVNASGGVWAKVAPYEWDNTSASFSYDDMAAAYGITDFSGVDSINIGATENVTLTITGVTITNCEDGIYVSMTDAERAEAYKNALIIVLASALAIIIAIIVIFMVILKRKSSYAYDAATGEYVKIDKNANK